MRSSGRSRSPVEWVRRHDAGTTLKELARTSDESVALELLPDLVLLARTRAAAAAAGLSLNQYVLDACRAFLDRAAKKNGRPS